MILKRNGLVLFIIFFCILIYFPSFLNTFSGDDWFHLRISQIGSLGEFINFFSFSLNTQSAAFYRPLPTQVYFFIFQKLFGLTVWPYHLFVLLCFGYSLYLVYLFAKRELKTDRPALISVLIYGISVSNFTRLYFLSAFQEIALVIFSLLCLLSFPKSILKATIFFVLALLSKETASVIPLLLLLFNFNYIKKNIPSILPIGNILLGYVYLRFMVFGGAVGDSYLWNFSPAKAANTLMWYVLWSLGAPEILVDYVGSGLKLVPKFFIDYPVWWKVIFPLLLGTIASAGLLFVRTIRVIDWSFGRYLLFFLISILPVLFLPSHKFALELGLPLIGFALAIAWLMTKKFNIFGLAFLIFYILLNLSMNYLTYTRHYSVSRGEISRKVYDYFTQNYPVYPEGKYFVFINDSTDYGEQWGQSKQISQALSGSDFFKVFYHSPDTKVYYQDISESPPRDANPIYLSTKQFLNQ